MLKEYGYIPLIWYLPQMLILKWKPRFRVLMSVEGKVKRVLVVSLLIIAGKFQDESVRASTDAESTLLFLDRYCLPSW